MSNLALKYSSTESCEPIPTEQTYGIVKMHDELTGSSAAPAVGVSASAIEAVNKCHKGKATI